MAVTVDPADEHAPRAPLALDPRVDGLHAGSVCPYLIAADGTWRSARPAREHRCGAIDPPLALTPEKQRSLCLAEAHVTCATFQAARARSLGVRSSDLPRESAPSLWPAARTAPIVLEPARTRLTSFPGVPAPGRTGGQVLLGVLMVAAFVAVVLARSGSPGPTSTIPPPTVAPASIPASPANTPRPTPAASSSASPSTFSPSPAASAAPSPSAAAARTYKVLRGDTLLKIAARFGVTVKALSDVNGITDPSLLRIGQVLTIP